MTTVHDVVGFWLDEIGPKGWYVPGEGLDQEIRDRFEQVWWDTVNGANALWLTYATGTLAYLILMDQMPRICFAERPALLDQIDRPWPPLKRRCKMGGI